MLVADKVTVDGKTLTSSQVVSVDVNNSEMDVGSKVVEIGVKIDAEVGSVEEEYFDSKRVE